MDSSQLSFEIHSFCRFIFATIIHRAKNPILSKICDTSDNIVLFVICLRLVTLILYKNESSSFVQNRPNVFACSTTPNIYKNSNCMQCFDVLISDNLNINSIFEPFCIESLVYNYS